MKLLHFSNRFTSLSFALHYDKSPLAKEYVHFGYEMLLNYFIYGPISQCFSKNIETFMAYSILTDIANFNFGKWFLGTKRI